MSPSVVRSVVDALAIALRFDRPADLALREFFRARPALGRRDRGIVAETVFDVLRRARQYQAVIAHDAGRLRYQRALALLSFDRRGLVRTDPPADLSEDERRWLQRTRRFDLPGCAPAVRASVPDRLWEVMTESIDPAQAEAIALAWLEPAPLDLRVNTLKATPAQAIASLAASDIEAVEIDGFPGALTVTGKPALERCAAFRDGWVEVQDRGSQVLAALAAPRRGQIVVDFCAGAGGKTLALAAATRSTGQVYACDVSATRLSRLRPRLARAGASNVQPFAIDREDDPKLARLAARADVVLVDAPCSGTGTLRRNPDLKGRFSASMLDGLGRSQRAILGAAARLVKPGGALIYGTCSVLPRENEEVVAWFEANHPGWRREPVAPILSRQGYAFAASADGCLRLRPGRDDCDGFFATRWTRSMDRDA